MPPSRHQPSGLVSGQKSAAVARSPGAADRRFCTRHTTDSAPTRHPQATPLAAPPSRPRAARGTRSALSGPSCAASAVPIRRAYHKTTHSHHRFRRHPNLLKPGPEQVVACRPNQVWVADITYLPTRHGMSYLSLVTDAYSRKIVGHHVHESLRSQDVEQALRNALRQRLGSEPLIHHSDRGIQYCCDSYQKIHRQYGIQCSMTDGYDCYQNALAERVNGILKTEFLLVQPGDVCQARTMVNESVEIYNSQRPHLALKYKTPNAVHCAFKMK